MNSLYDNIQCQLALTLTDIGAGNTTSSWLSMVNQHKMLFIVEAVGAPADLFDVVKLQQATDGSGTGAKDISGGAITDFSKYTAALDRFLLEVDARALDMKNGFDFVAAVVSAGAGTDNVIIWAISDPVYHNEGISTTDPDENILKVPAG